MVFRGFDCCDVCVCCWNQETEKFRDHLMSKLTKKVERYGDSAEEVVGVCTEVFFVLSILEVLVLNFDL